MPKRPDKQSVGSFRNRLLSRLQGGASVNEIISLLMCATEEGKIDPTAENEPFGKGRIPDNNPWVRAFDWFLGYGTYEDVKCLYDCWKNLILEAHQSGLDAEWEMAGHIGIPEFLYGLSCLMQHRVKKARHHFEQARYSELKHNEENRDKPGYEPFSHVSGATQRGDLCALLQRAIEDASEREAELKAQLKQRHVGPDSDNMLIILKQWNSTTPVFPGSTGVGGGYFLIWNGRGIAIDPGFDFVRSLERYGFGIGDVDAIVVTHNHIDHTNDLETIFTLKYELNEQLPKEERGEILFYASEGVHQKFDWKPCKVLKLGEAYHLFPHVLVHPQPARHDEKPLGDKFPRGKSGVGLLFDLSLKMAKGEEKHIRLGITSDTAYHVQLPECYRGVDVLVAHVGTLEEDRDVSPEGARQHLGVGGVLELARRLRAEEEKQEVLILVSELGEELEGQEKFLESHVNELANFAAPPPRRSIHFTRLGDAVRFSATRYEFGHLDERRVFVPKYCSREA